MSTPMLTAQGLTMQYPGVRALGGVDFDLRAGEIHALCGENGAGKSTLIKILCGVIPARDHGGTVTLDGTACRFKNPGDALRAGIRVIHQELALCPDLTVTENIFLGEEIMWGGVAWGLPDTRRMLAEARVTLDALGLRDVVPEARVGGLPVGLRQMIEIARALKISPDTPYLTTRRDERSHHDLHDGIRRSEGERNQKGQEARLDASPRTPTTQRDARSPAKVLILDEPTSALSSREAERLLATLQRLREGGMAILYISHRLDEVFRLADRITVLRSGESVGTLERARTPEGDASHAPFDAAHVVSLMTGAKTRPRTSPGTPGTRDPEAGGLPDVAEAMTSAAHRASPHGAPLLTVRDWTLPDPANPARMMVDNVSFDLRAGEILGFAGLMGAGRTELMESLCGLYPAAGRGALSVDGVRYVPRDAAHAQRHGIALVCEDRRARGLFADKSVRMNMTISALRDFCTLGCITRDGRDGRERTEARARVDALRIKTPDTEFIAGNLSGGNQQKALIARALLTRPRILILDEPTRGIDVGAKEELYALVETLAEEGLAILLVSSETEEVLRLAQRVIILRDGRIAAERPASALTLEETLALASGGTPA